MFLGGGGPGGQGGFAFGGAVFLDPVDSFQAINVTIGQSTAQGGKGGNGGSGDPDRTASAGGDGGNGGSAGGGLFGADVPPSTSIRFGFSTLGEGVVTGSLHGSGGKGATHGNSGQDGTATGAALQVTGGHAAVESSAFFGSAAVALCVGSAAIATTYASDASCGTAIVAPSLGSWFTPLHLESAVPAYVPRFKHAAVDSTGCVLAPTSPEFPVALPVTADMQGTPRPQGATCDIGAIEADYIFVGDFD